MDIGSMCLDEFLGSAFARPSCDGDPILFGNIRRRRIPVKHRRALRRLCLAKQSKSSVRPDAPHIQDLRIPREIPLRAPDAGAVPRAEGAAVDYGSVV